VVEHWTTKHKISCLNPRLAPTRPSGPPSNGRCAHMVVFPLFSLILLFEHLVKMWAKRLMPMPSVSRLCLRLWQWWLSPTATPISPFGSTQGFTLCLETCPCTEKQTNKNMASLGCHVQISTEVAAWCDVLQLTVCNYDPDVISITEPWLLHLSLIWSPYCYIDRDLIEKVQWRCTQMIPVLHHLSYNERLIKTGLWSLENRRVRSELTEVFKKYFWFVHC